MLLGPGQTQAQTQLEPPSQDLATGWLQPSQDNNPVAGNFESAGEFLKTTYSREK